MLLFGSDSNLLFEHPSASLEALSLAAADLVTGHAAPAPGNLRTPLAGAAAVTGAGSTACGSRSYHGASESVAAVACLVLLAPFVAVASADAGVGEEDTGSECYCFLHLR